VVNPALRPDQHLAKGLRRPNRSSLTCTKSNAVGGDVSHYMFADDIHPTPYEYWLVARYVLKDMAVKGWL
jgi:outer membrane lipase/esterase